MLHRGVGELEIQTADGSKILAGVQGNNVTNGCQAKDAGLLRSDGSV